LQESRHEKENHQRNFSDFEICGRQLWAGKQFTIHKRNKYMGKILIKIMINLTVETLQ
jgi:hypothetical protein